MWKTLEELDDEILKRIRPARAILDSLADEPFEAARTLWARSGAEGMPAALLVWKALEDEAQHCGCYWMKDFHRASGGYLRRRRVLSHLGLFDDRAIVVLRAV